MLLEKYKLNNNEEINKIAFGTWQISNEEVVEAVKAALEIGYRHIDTAIAYENEEGIARGIKESNISRDEIFITSKIPAHIKSYEEAKLMIKDSLKRLDTDYLDLMLIHAPKPWNELFNGSENNYFKENLEVWKAMEEAVEAGLIKSIGVSNFEIEDIQNIIDNAKIKPVVNQIRVHIGHTPKGIINSCKEQDIVVMAFSPNASGKLINNEEVANIANKYQVSTARLSIRYDYQLGLIPLPRSTNYNHILENKEINFEISKEDMAVLANIDEISVL